MLKRPFSIVVSIDPGAHSPDQLRNIDPRSGIFDRFLLASASAALTLCSRESPVAFSPALSLQSSKDAGRGLSWAADRILVLRESSTANAPD
jgi:hypothetical protein